MRIAYIAPYQGPDLLKRRPIVRNLSLAGRVKVERLAELLLRRGHSIEVISQGEVVERALKFYRGFSESRPFHAEIPVFYSSALPVKFVNGWWSTRATLQLFETRHRRTPFDLVVIYNLKGPQVACALHAMERLSLPVVLEYEDGAFGSGKGGTEKRQVRRTQRLRIEHVLASVSACVAVSPDLLGQTPVATPKFLLRGVVGDEIAAATRQNGPRKNWVVFSGTHFRAYGLEQLITAWRRIDLPDWELHLAGQGELTSRLQQLAQGDSRIIFRGLLNREENARFLAEARIGINPHDTSHTAGNVFAFKMIEYLAAGTHVITTHMGELPAELEHGITYMSDNRPETIAEQVLRVIQSRGYERTAAEAALRHYGPAAVSRSLDAMFHQVMDSRQVR